MLHILIGGAGCGKSTCLIQHLQKQLKAGEQILTLVPEQFSYEFDQKLYRILGPVAFNQLETHSFKSLARAVFQRFGCVPDGKTNADELTKWHCCIRRCCRFRNGRKNCSCWENSAGRLRLSANWQ